MNPELLVSHFLGNLKHNRTISKRNCIQILYVCIHQPFAFEHLCQVVATPHSEKIGMVEIIFADCIEKYRGRDSITIITDLARMPSEVMQHLAQLCDGVSLCLLMQTAVAMLDQRPALREALLRTTRCQLCKGPMHNPHQLTDCKHQACGTCLRVAIHGIHDPTKLWLDWACFCGAVAAHQPKPLGGYACEAAKKAAGFIMDAHGFQAWKARAGRAIRWGQFPGCYWDEEQYPTCALANLKSLPAEHMYRISHCPTDRNFSGFPVNVEGQYVFRRDVLSDVIRDYCRHADVSHYDIIFVESDTCSDSEDSEAEPVISYRLADLSEALPEPEAVGEASAESARDHDRNHREHRFFDGSDSMSEDSVASVTSTEGDVIRPTFRDMLNHNHARQLALATGGGTRDQCINLLFRGGPCDICGGPCFATLSDKPLITRLLAGRKPVGTFARKNKWKTCALAKLLQNRGLATWKGKNKWGMYEVVACLHPDTFIPEAMGTPRGVAFSQAFIDEELPLAVRGALYGYPACGLY